MDLKSIPVWLRFGQIMCIYHVRSLIAMFVCFGIFFTLHFSLWISTPLLHSYDVNLIACIYHLDSGFYLLKVFEPCDWVFNQLDMNSRYCLVAMLPLFLVSIIWILDSIFVIVYGPA